MSPQPPKPGLWQDGYSTGFRDGALCAALALAGVLAALLGHWFP